MLKNKIIRHAFFFAAILLAACLSFFRAFEVFELQTYDTRFKLRPIQTQSPDIAIIEIADDSITKLGRWPFDRELHANLIQVLSKYGAKAILFDVIFSSESPKDFPLVEMARSSGIVYCPYVFRLTNKVDKGFVEAASYDAKVLPDLADALKGTGFINAMPDIDGKNRRVPLFIRYEGKLYPHIAFKLSCDYLGLDIDQAKIFPGRYVDVSGKKVPTDARGNVLLDYAGAWARTYEHYSYFDILASEQLIKNGKKPYVDLDKLKDKVCFVGLTATGSHDLNPTPLEPRAPSVGVHSTIFNMMAYNMFISRAGRLLNLLILALLSLCAFFIVLKSRPLIGFISITFFTILFVALSFGLFVFLRLWIDVFCPVFVMIAVYLSTTTYKYINEIRQRLLLENELKTAKRIQQSFLPEETPKIEGITIAASMAPAHEVAGDLYDFVQTGEGTLGLMVGDVSGKGMPAALFMAKVMSEFRYWAKVKQDPAEALFNLNNQVSTTSKSGLFVTVSYNILDYKAKKLITASAGHLPVIVAKQELNKTALINCEEGMPIGLMSEVPFGDKVVQLDSGDVVVLYSDGVTEAKNAKKDEYGQDRLIEIIHRNKRKAAEEIRQAIEADIKKFVGHAPQHDDITIIVIKGTF